MKNQYDEDARFVITYVQKMALAQKLYIMVDQETGVNYIMLRNENGVSSITPLLKEDGTITVTPQVMK